MVVVIGVVVYDDEYLYMYILGWMWGSFLVCWLLVMCCFVMVLYSVLCSVCGNGLNVICVGSVDVCG